jgi:hypothetical protein
MIVATLVVLFVGGLVGIGIAMDRLKVFANSPDRWEHDDEKSKQSNDANF